MRRRKRACLVTPHACCLPSIAGLNKLRFHFLRNRFRRRHQRFAIIAVSRGNVGRLKILAGRHEGLNNVNELLAFFTHRIRHFILATEFRQNRADDDGSGVFRAPVFATGDERCGDAGDFGFQCGIRNSGHFSNAVTDLFPCEQLLIASKLCAKFRQERNFALGLWMCSIR